MNSGLLEHRRDYVIWSHEHTAWWAPNHRGYTPDLEKAGLYTEAEAANVVLNVIPAGTEIAMSLTTAQVEGPPPTPWPTIVWGRWETRSFEFEVFARTEAEAEALMEKAWAAHCKWYDADPGLWEEYREDFYTITVGLDVVLRDRSPMDLESGRVRLVR